MRKKKKKLKVNEKEMKGIDRASYDDDEQYEINSDRIVTNYYFNNKNHR